MEEMLEEKLTVSETILKKERLLIPLPLAVFILSVSLTLSVYHLFTGVFGQVDPFLQRVFCLTLLLVLCFIHYPLGRKSWNSKFTLFSMVDFLLIALSIFCLIYPSHNYEAFQYRVTSPSTMDIVWGTILILLVLEASRRVIGWVMIIISAIFIVLCSFGEYLPGFLYGTSVSWSIMIQVISMGDWGILGIPMGVVTDYLILFLIFVAFLIETGAADVFINLATAIAGQWSGGPAKVSVFSSALIGTISGSAVANVVADGPFNIPLMKKIGYRADIAGAIEACTSTGGQIMPPIMGAAAFLMASFLGVSYWSIALAAVIPAVIFFASLFFVIHFEARKAGLKGLSPEEKPKLIDALKASYTVLIPLILLMVILDAGYPVRIAAVAAIISVVFLSMLRKKTRLTSQRFVKALEGGANNCIMVGITCAAAGIIIGGFYTTGLQTQLIALITHLSGGYLTIALLWTALVCLVLGMAVTTTVVYVLAYVFVIPLLIQIGVEPLAAHFYCLWWGVLAPITPPVGLAFYAAAAIAQCDPMRCGLSAMRIGIILYLMPFAIVFNPALILLGTPSEIIIVTTTTLIGALYIASGLAGWMRYKVNLPSRILFIAGGLLLFYPENMSGLAGAALLAIPTALHLLRSPESSPS